MEKDIHRLVVEAFIPNPYNLPCVNHKDENTHNNRVDNLEWCSYKHNSNWGTCQERKVKTRTKNGGRWAEKKVMQLTTDGTIINEFESVNDAARFIVSKPIYISRVCRGLRKSYKGYFWLFKN